MSRRESMRRRARASDREPVPGRETGATVLQLVRTLLFLIFGGAVGGVIGLVCGAFVARNFVTATSSHPLFPSGEALGTVLVVLLAGIVVGGIAGLFVEIRTRSPRRRR